MVLHCGKASPFPAFWFTASWSTVAMKAEPSNSQLALLLLRYIASRAFLLMFFVCGTVVFWHRWTWIFQKYGINTLKLQLTGNLKVYDNGHLCLTLTWILTDKIPKLIIAWRLQLPINLLVEGSSDKQVLKASAHLYATRNWVRLCLFLRPVWLFSSPFSLLSQCMNKHI